MPKYQVLVMPPEYKAPAGLVIDRQVVEVPDDAEWLLVAACTDSEEIKFPRHTVGELNLPPGDTD